MPDHPASQSGPRVMIVAGEASGDLHGGNLAAELAAKLPGISLFGMGGAAMRRAGVDTRVDIAAVAVIGLWEVVTHFADIKRAFDTLAATVRYERPDLVVLIDYPDFNLRLAKVAKAAGVPVVYYISPQVWAWRKGRVRLMSRLVRRMLVVFPFEEEFYRKAGVDCRYVGNPLLDGLGDPRPREELAAKFGLDPARPILGLLPGSRRKELAFHLPVMLKAWNLLRRDIPGLQAVIPAAETLTPGDFEPYLSERDAPVLVEGDTGGVMDLMDAAAVASGTATLQTALHGKPMAIIYRLSPLTYWIGRLIIDVPFIGMVNIVAGEGVVPELIQGDATPEKIAAELRRYFEDRAHYDATVARLALVRRKLGAPGASGRAADEVLSLLSSATESWAIT